MGLNDFLKTMQLWQDRKVLPFLNWSGTIGDTFIWPDLKKKSLSLAKWLPGQELGVCEASKRNGTGFLVSRHILDFNFLWLLQWLGHVQPKNKVRQVFSEVYKLNHSTDRVGGKKAIFTLCHVRIAC